MALAILLYVLINGVYTKRTLTYQPDFDVSITKDITGWYPEVRGQFQNDKFNLVSEPLYVKFYTPLQFDRLIIEGSVDYVDESIRLGLRQENGDWYWQEIQNPDFSLIYDLGNVEIKNNKVEMILSVPDLKSTSTVSLHNNWQFIFDR